MGKEKPFIGFLGKNLPNNLIEEHKLEFVVATDVEDAKKRLLRKWKGKHVHVDGIQEIKTVDNYNIILKK